MSNSRTPDMVRRASAEWCDLQHAIHGHPELNTEGWQHIKIDTQSLMKSTRLTRLLILTDTNTMEVIILLV